MEGVRKAPEGSGRGVGRCGEGRGESQHRENAVAEIQSCLTEATRREGERQRQQEEGREEGGSRRAIVGRPSIELKKATRTGWPFVASASLTQGALQC